MFLARSHPEAKLLPADPAGEARCTEWLSWISIDLHGIGYGQLWRPHRFVADPALHEAVKSKGMENILTAYDHIDHILSDGREWAVPSQYTVVDAYLVVFWLWGRRIGLEMDTSWPNWAQLMNKVLERLAVKQALELEGPLEMMSITAHQACVADVRCSNRLRAGAVSSASLRTQTDSSRVAQPS